MNMNKHVCIATARQAEDLRRCKVIPVPPPAHTGGGRAGSVLCTLEEFTSRFGEPHECVPKDLWYTYEHDFCDGKVSAEWYISTPRGLATVYDYWWNPKGILSIGTACGHDNRSPLWAVRWLAQHGLRSTFCIDNKELKALL